MKIYANATRPRNIKLMCKYIPAHTFNPNAKPKTVRVSEPDLLSALMMLCDVLNLRCSSDDIKDMVDIEGATAEDIIDYIAYGNGDTDYDEIHLLVNETTGEEYISNLLA